MMIMNFEMSTWNTLVIVSYFFLCVCVYVFNVLYQSRRANALGVKWNRTQYPKVN